ncbi:hypothetical protein OKW33_006627 [Paraburkholderia atlantica]|uniref:Iron-containing redox enzyme family protein n=1 Tax=Paraburkholderia atlantica TaxID=2654982 RepID=A0A6I1Q6N0_PARAM|nr:hypothetical protein [Paraburkholderia atlantica]MBB5420421.1 hypothetical protein [Paraburkholderia atlantica]MBB5428868.1 hypothetical protein [Paraburkholderia atlantica]MPW09965.1 hypothetical protein [Paraburkholderia atlantica]NUY34319.1 hypothetical protein [Paraburkholderia atlantica]
MSTANDRTYFEQVAQQAVEQMFATSPETAAFHRGDWIDSEYYRRHLVETVLRIRLNNEVDAFALYKIGSKDNTLAQILAQYLAEGYGHEGKFLHDLKKFGLSANDVDRVAPLHSTDKLIGYLYLSIGRNGPLPTMVWNWLLEWYTNRYSKSITEAAARAFGHDHVKGSLEHIQYAESHKHYDIIWIALQRAIGGWGSIESAEMYLRNFVGLIHEYFDELRVTTVPRTESITSREAAT